MNSSSNGLCEYAPSCEIYERARSIVDKLLPGDLTSACLQIDDICSSPSRISQRCYFTARELETDKLFEIERV